MARVVFRTLDPCDHVSRALDFVRKMGFTLRELQVFPDREQTFHVVLSIEVAGELTVMTLVHRIGNLVGVSVVECDDEPVFCVKADGLLYRAPMVDYLANGSDQDHQVDRNCISTAASP